MATSVDGSNDGTFSPCLHREVLPLLRRHDAFGLAVRATCTVAALTIRFSA